jgi:uncharacterized protein YigA (DUF484 family)
MEATKNIDNISAEQVAEYLRNNRDFFQLRDDLLLEMNLPNQGPKGATSLVEKQVSVLRERNIEMRNKLATLLQNAEQNDKVFKHTRDLVLALLEAKTLDAVGQTLRQSFLKSFKLDAFSLVIFAEPSLYKDTTLSITSREQAEQHISGLINARNSVCGILRDNELAFLFKDKASKVGSAATMALGGDKKVGLLALGSSSNSHFKSDMDTLFLCFIADVVCKIITPMLQR